MTFARAAALIFAATFLQSCREGCPRLSAAPRPAQEAGYCKRTFFSSDFSSSTVHNDPGDDTPVPDGLQWYRWRFFWSADPKSIALKGADGVQLRGEGAALATASPRPDTTAGFVGTAFGGGGYFEATLQFNPDDVYPKGVKGPSSWPAFWSMALEHLVRMPDERWPGQDPAYKHFIEADFMEYDVGGGNKYGGTLHDWYGCEPMTPTCQVALNGGLFTAPVRRPARIDTGFHRYGFLWKPATDRTRGSGTYYFDGVPVGTDIWNQYDPAAPPPPKSPLGSIIDQDHLVLILGTGKNGSGVEVPMIVQMVSVWQRSAEANWTPRSSPPPTAGQ